MSNTSRNFHTPLSHGVYVEGIGVVQPGQTVKAKPEDVKASVDAGVLAAGSAPEQDTEGDPKFELSDPAVTDDPNPATIEVDSGVPSPEAGTETQEEGE